MAKYKRILLKLSGESLMGEKQYGIDEKDWQNMLNKSKKSTSKEYRLVSLSEEAIYFAD